MTQKDKALKMAIEALENINKLLPAVGIIMDKNWIGSKTLEACKAALSEPDGWVADAKRIDWINREIISIDTFEMGESYGWVFSQYYLGEKEPREIYRSYIEDFRKSIDAAMLASEPKLNTKD